MSFDMGWGARELLLYPFILIGLWNIGLACLIVSLTKHWKQGYLALPIVFIGLIILVGGINILSILFWSMGLLPLIIFLYIGEKTANLNMNQNRTRIILIILSLISFVGCYFSFKIMD